VATNVIMPALGMAQETGKVIRWLKTEGAQVARGDPLIEIETDKATVEVESPASGILAQVTAHDGDEVPVGHTIAVIRTPDEVPSASPAPTDLASPAPGPLTESPPPPSLPATSEGSSPAYSVLGHRRIGSRLPPASPKARRLAYELGVDVAALPGTGLGGAVVADDVLAARTTTAATEPVAPVSPPVAPAPGPADVVTVSSAWRLMAERTAQSWTTAPHFFLLREVNAGRLVAWREAWQRRFGAEVTYTDLLVMLVGASLRQHTRLNATWDNGTIKVHPEINIGVAAATADALVVPVIHRADTLTITEIAGRLREGVARAQAGKLRPEDIRGGTFTVSNLGMYGVDAFVAVINPPQAAILAVGKIASRVVAREGELLVQPMMMLSLSCDHRVVDGARAAQFLQTLVDLIEEPLTILGGR
jgi:pyruvate dehydrogenase E2 component (dihydrolipoyllysine-residue acetyltransferase)